MAKKPKTATKTKSNGSTKPRPEVEKALEEVRELPKDLSPIERMALDNILDWKAVEDQKVQVLQQGTMALCQTKLNQFLDILFEERGIDKTEDLGLTFSAATGAWGFKDDPPEEAEEEEEEETDVED